MSFSTIAPIYDRFNDLDVYEQWLDFTLSSLDQAPSKVLDVACGTGWFTQLLEPFCQSITAFDIDEGMLKIASKEQLPTSTITYQQADMLNLAAFDEDFDLVTCYADSLCFLEKQADVAVALKEIYQRLAKGGTFLFDVWTPYQVSKAFDGFSYFDSDETAAIMWDSESEVDKLEVSHYLTVFDKETGQTGKDLYHRHDVILTERTYPLEAYQRLLKAAGFNLKKVEVLVDFGAKYYDATKHSKADRWFFRCVK